WFQSCMVRSTMGRPCCWSTAATVEESTPPDIATAMRPGCVSARSGRVSNCICTDIASILARDGVFANWRSDSAELGHGGGHHLQREIDFSLCGVAAQAEAQGGARFLRGETDGGENVRRLDGAGRASSASRNSKALQVERDEQGFAFDTRESDIRGVRRAR